MRFIRKIFRQELGTPTHNRELSALYLERVAGLAADSDARTKLEENVRFGLIGDRTRNVYADLPAMRTFKDRASTFQAGACEAVTALARQIEDHVASFDITFDALITTTGTGNLMPGLSYQLAKRLGKRVPSSCLMVDLGNAGCTGGIRALELARSLGPGFDNLLVVALEIPSTLVNLDGTDASAWQGNCTFGDGAAALWVSSRPGEDGASLAIEQVRGHHRADTALDLIHWGYRDYYHFELEEAGHFDIRVRDIVAASLQECEPEWKDEPRWAIHPAGITLLVRLARKLGLAQDAITPSSEHYRRYSNMSSVGLIHILEDVAGGTPRGAAVNLLSMGAGFAVLYGRVRKLG